MRWCEFQLEMRLARKEEGLLEKEMILEQVARLSDRLRKKAESGGQDSLLLAKQVRQSYLFCLMHSLVSLKKSGWSKN